MLVIVKPVTLVKELTKKKRKINVRILSLRFIVILLQTVTSDTRPSIRIIKAHKHDILF